LFLSCLSSEQKEESIQQKSKQTVSNPKHLPPHKNLNHNGGHPPHGGQQGGKMGLHPPNGMQGGKQISFSVKPDFQWEGVVDEQPKSIVLISLDTVRADRLSVYGGRAETPNLQQLVDAGSICSQAVTHFPETALSHWSMMSGVMPLVHGNVPGNGGSLYKGPTLAEITKEHGYQTAAFIGGVTLTDSASGLSRGFDLYDDQFTFSQEDMSRKGSEVTQRAVRWIQKQQSQSKSYFAFVHYFDAHFPYTPPAPWDTKYDADYTGTIDGTDRVLAPYRDGQKKPSARDVEHVLALYDGEISALDATIAPLLSVLDKNTVVAVTSDHGESFEHGYYFNHRAGLWDSVMHIPLIIRAPGISPKTVVDRQVGLIDLTPTLLSLAGLRSDTRMQGTSIFAAKQHDLYFAHTDPWMSEPQFAARTLNWKWIAQERGDLVYRIGSDPLEEKQQEAIPAELKEAKSEAASLLESLSAHQETPPRPRQIGEEECKRLQLLGYVQCQ
jgi:arylsulfatase A-like enzyme